jgi:hypothetical protein
MRWLLFLSRLAFICGFFFILSISLLIYEWTTDQDIIGTIITIGYLMGMVIVPVTLLCYLGVLLVRRNLVSIVPPWLIFSNIIFLLLLFGYIYYINSHYRAL